MTAVGDGALAATELERYAAALQKKTGLHPVQPAAVPQEVAPPSENSRQADGLFSTDMLAQLDAVFQKMSSSLRLKLYLDSTPLSSELQGYMEELCSLTDKLSLEISNETLEDRPCVRICREDNVWTGLAFHGVPGGHEFTSFVLGLYNASGPGQTLEAEMLRSMQTLKSVDMKILVSLSCTMCPELVTAAQRIAVENPGITAEVYDLNHFPVLREKYKVMSVPCLVLDNGRTVSFGKKNIPQLLELLPK